MGIVLRLLVAAGLLVDAYIHWDFASHMGPNPGGIGGDVLFQGQAVAAVVAAVLVLVWARWWTYAIAFLVAASAVGALFLYYFVDVGALGPLPNMHEPVWYAEKTWSAVGEGVAAVAALIGVVVTRPGSRERTSAGV